MTAPDLGLTDLIAAHWRSLDLLKMKYTCSCGDWEFRDDDRERACTSWCEHLASVVEQHTNGRATELDWDELVAAIPEGWELRESAQLEEVSRVRQRDLEASQATTARWRARAEKAEATIARVHEIRCGNCNNPFSEGSGNCVSDASRPHIYDEADLRAALEGWP